MPGGGGGGTGKECDQESQENKFPFEKISNTFYYYHNHNVFRPTTANIDHADIDGNFNKHIGDKCMQIQPKPKVQPNDEQIDALNMSLQKLIIWN